MSIIAIAKFIPLPSFMERIEKRFESFTQPPQMIQIPSKNSAFTAWKVYQQMISRCLIKDLSNLQLHPSERQIENEKKMAFTKRKATQELQKNPAPIFNDIYPRETKK